MVDKNEAEWAWCKLINKTRGESSKSRQSLVDLINLQPNYYQGILEKVSKIESGGKNTNLAFWRNLSANIIEFLKDSGVKEVNGVDGGYTTFSVLPVMSLSEYDEFLSIIDSLKSKSTFEEQVSFANFVLAGIIYKIIDKKGIANASDFDQIIPRFIIDINKFVSMSVSLYNRDSDRGSLAKINNQFAKLKLEVDSSIVETKNNLALIEADAKGRLNSILSEVERFQRISAEAASKADNLLSEHGKIFDKAKQELEGLAEATVSRANLAALGSLWDTLASRSKKALYWFGFAFVFMVIIGIVTLICGKDFIVNFLIDAPIGKSLDDFTPAGLLSLQVSRIVVLTIPLILYLWALKMVVRMFVRSLALYDDATQRKTILDSYHFLGEKGKIDKDAQPIVIGAVCRPVPGHGTDGVELPDLAQLLQAGQNFFRK